MWPIHVIKAFHDNFIFALLGPDRKCAVVDPGDSGPVFDFLSQHNLRLTHILCTHHHNDHIGGVAELKSATHCLVTCSAFDQNRIDNNALVVSEQKPLQLWGRTIEVLDIPGHTLGHIAYWLRPEKALFVGDTVFSVGCGRLFEGSPEQMFASLQKIKALPLDTRLFFAHEYTLRNLEFVLAKAPSPEALSYQRECQQKLARGENTVPNLLSTELLINPFLKAKNVEDFARWREERNHW